MNHRSKPPGHVAVPLFLFGGLSVGLGVVAEMIGAFRIPTEMLREAWQSGGLTGCQWSIEAQERRFVRRKQITRRLLDEDPFHLARTATRRTPSTTYPDQFAGSVDCKREDGEIPLS